MLTYHPCSVCLSLISTDLPILSNLETTGTIYPKDQQSFHLLLHQSDPQAFDGHGPQLSPKLPSTWLEISPYRVMLTQQAHRHLSYRHFWEKGVYGISRYWLNDQPEQGVDQVVDQVNECPPEIHLRNFTRNLKLVGNPLPTYLRVEYELWTSKLQLGHYVLHLEIQH